MQSPLRMLWWDDRMSMRLLIPVQAGARARADLIPRMKPFAGCIGNACYNNNKLRAVSIVWLRLMAAPHFTQQDTLFISNVRSQRGCAEGFLPEIGIRILALAPKQGNFLRLLMN